MRSTILVILLLLFTMCDGLAQNESNWWYFGHQVGLNFNTTPTSVYANGKIMTFEGSSSISHPKTGQLLFYSDGITVWNNLHQTMPNGTGLRGHSTSSHSVCIVPVPKDSNHYLLLTTGFPATVGLNMSYVDMTLASGLGDLMNNWKSRFDSTWTGNYKRIMGNQPVSDKLATVRHANGEDYWAAAIQNDTWELYAFRIDSNGIDTSSPVISQVNGTGSNKVPHYGCMKFSPNGKKMAVAYGPNREVHLFDFDAKTGKFSNRQVLYYKPQGNTFLPYGIEFSPNSKYLYVASRGIIQFNTHLDSAVYINTSGVLITKPSFQMQNGQLQLGPDKKIYFARGNLNYLSVINKPNNYGSASGFQEKEIVAKSGSLVRLGLPIFSASLFSELGIQMKDGCFGDSTIVTLTDTNSIDSVLFNYGDPSSGIFNTNKKIFNKHYFTRAGIYGVTAYVFRSNKSGAIIRDTIIDSLRVGSRPIVKLGNDTSLCWGDNIGAKIIATGVSSFYWDDSSQNYSRSIKKPGKYWLTASDRCGVGSDSISISRIYSRGLNLGSDTTLCNSSHFTINIKDSAATYLWDNGSKSYIRAITGPGKYWANLKNYCGDYSDTIVVDSNSTPNIDLGADTAICDKVFYALIAKSKNATYKWHDGSNGDQYLIRSSGKKWVEVKNICGLGSDTINVLRESELTFRLGNDTTLCANDSIWAYALPNPPYYNWSDSSKANKLQIKKAGSYWLSSSNACGFRSDTLVVKKWPLLVPSIQYATKTLSSDNFFVKYVWYLNGKAIIGAYNKNYTVAAPGKYHVRTEDVNGCIERSKVLDIGENGILGVSQLESLTKHIKVFPNPANTELNIQIEGDGLDIFEIELIDMRGRVVKKIKTVENLLTWPIESIVNGSYRLSIQHLKSQSIIPVVIAH